MRPGIPSHYIILPMKTENLTFGEAIEAARSGKLIQRYGWNGKGMFVFMVEGSQVEIHIAIQQKTLSPDFRNFLLKKYQDDPDQFLTQFNHFCMWDAGGNIVPGWLASQTDMLARDWKILEVKPQT